MSDLTTSQQTLNEAFAELERRADVFAAATPHSPSGQRPPGGPHRVLLAAASVVAVAAVATTVALLAGSGSRTGGNGPTNDQPAGARPHSQPSASVRTAQSPVIAKHTPISVPPATGTAPATRVIPTNAAELAQRLQAVLGNTATFTWTAPAGRSTPYIVGTLTRTSPHRSGGFDLQIDVGQPGDKAICEDPGESKCTLRRLPDHSSLSIGRENQGDRLYMVDLVRPNGISLLMHVSTNSDPKGGGTNLSNTPPLSTGEMTKVLESPKWMK